MNIFKKKKDAYDEISGDADDEVVKMYEDYETIGSDDNDTVNSTESQKLTKNLNESSTVENALTAAPPLETPRIENDEIGDDMSETSDPPGWNELNREQQLDILDWQMDLYWDENKKPLEVNWWRLTAICMFIINFGLLIQM
tara:strand:- start:124 stop:549 length:426 start_codon:yes stop_codon:yes gene_type:complete